MKKIILIVLLMFFQNSAVFSACPTAMCVAPYDLSGKGANFFTTITGMNFLSEKIAQSIIKQELKKSTKEKFKVKMESFSASDLKSGRFKSLSISGKNLEIDGVYFTLIEAKTLCDFNYVHLSKDEITFKEPFLMDYSIIISDEDLKKTVNANTYMQKFKTLDLNFCGLNLFKAQDVDVKIYDGRFYTILKGSLPFLNKPVSIVSSAKLKVEDGQIVLYNVKLDNSYVQKHVDMTKFVSLLNWINPLNFSLDVLGNNRTKMQVQRVDLEKDKLTISGYILVPKNHQEKIK